MSSSWIKSRAAIPSPNHNRNVMSTVLVLFVTLACTTTTTAAFTPIFCRNSQNCRVSPAAAATAPSPTRPLPQRRPPQTSQARGGQRLGAGTALADVVSSSDTSAANVSPSSDVSSSSDSSIGGPATGGDLVTTMNPRELIRRLSTMVSSSTNYETTLRSAVAARRLFLEEDPTTPSLNSVLLIWGKVAQQLTEWHNAKEGAQNQQQDVPVPPSSSGDNDTGGEGGAGSSSSSSDAILEEYLKDVDIREAGVYTSKDAAMLAEELLEKHMSLTTTNSFNAVMECWTKSREEIAPERVQALFDKIKNPDEASFNALVEAYAYCKNVNDRIGLMEALPVSYASSTRTCNALLHAYSKAASSAAAPDSDRFAAEFADKALAALEALKANYRLTGDASQRPDIMSYTTVIDCLGRTRKQEYAVIADKLMNELKEGCNDRNSDNRFNPSIFIFTTLLRTWGRVDTPEAMARCHEILDESIEWAGPHVNSFTCMIQVLTKATCAEQPAQDALRLLQRMRSLSVEPTIVTYNAALEACSKQRDKGAAAALKIAFAIFKAIEQPSSSVSPTEWTYTALLGCVAGLLPASDERNKIASTVFRKAAAKQMVSKRMLFLLNRACDSNVFYDLLCHDMMPTINKKFDFDNIPAKWSKHSGTTR